MKWDVGLCVWCWNQMQSSKWIGKGSPRTKSTDRSVKDEGDVGCIFWLERYFPTWICSTWSDVKQTVVAGSFSVSEGCCGQEVAWIVGNPDLVVVPQQCNGALVALHKHLPDKISYIFSAPSTLLSGLSTSRLFPVPKVKTNSKGRRFQTIEEIQENTIR